MLIPKTLHLYNSRGPQCTQSLAHTKHYILYILPTYIYDIYQRISVINLQIKQNFEFLQISKENPEFKYHHQPMEKGTLKCAANYIPLTPISFLERSAIVYRDRVSVVYGDLKFTWKQTHDRCLRLASALNGLGISRGDVVSFSLYFLSPPLFVDYRLQSSLYYSNLLWASLLRYGVLLS